MGTKTNFQKKVGAYLISITSLSFISMMLYAIQFQRDFESGTSNSLGMKIGHLGQVLAVWFIALWIITFIISFIPFMLSLIFYRKDKTNLLPLAILGGFLGTTSAYIVSMLEYGPGAQGDIRTLMANKFFVLAPLFLISGVISGWFYWKIVNSNLIRSKK